MVPVQTASTAAWHVLATSAVLNATVATLCILVFSVMCKVGSYIYLNCITSQPLVLWDPLLYILHVPRPHCTFISSP